MKAIETILSSFLLNTGAAKDAQKAEA